MVHKVYILLSGSLKCSIESVTLRSHDTWTGKYVTAFRRKPLRPSSLHENIKSDVDVKKNSDKSAYFNRSGVDKNIVAVFKGQTDGTIVFPPKRRLPKYQLTQRNCVEELKAWTAPRRKPEIPRRARTSCLNRVAVAIFMSATELYGIIFFCARLGGDTICSTISNSSYPLIFPDVLFYHHIDSFRRKANCPFVRLSATGVIFQTNTVPVYPSRSVGLVVQ